MVSLSRFLFILQVLIDPFRFMALSASYIPTTIAHLIRTGQYSILFSLSAFKDAWFAQFWSVVGTRVRTDNTPRVAPLVSLAHGVVLDIGPGSGEWVALFDPKKVTRVLGIEPNRDHHAQLRERVKEAGLEGIYEIVPVGVEDLGDRWVGRGEVDTVVTVQCLCSVPEPKKMIGDLYGYLKKGGIWIVYEHVKTFEAQGWALGLYQRAVDLLWPTFLGGCSITRDTARWLKEVGAWKTVDLKRPDDAEPWHLVPHIMGTLKK